MKKLVTLALFSIVATTASARLSEGEAAIIGGFLGYALRANQAQTYPVQPPVYMTPAPVYVQPVPRAVTPEDYCESQTTFRGVYNPGLARMMCFDQLNRQRWELQQLQRGYQQ